MAVDVAFTQTLESLFEVSREYIVTFIVGI